LRGRLRKTAAVRILRDVLRCHVAYYLPGDDKMVPNQEATSSDAELVELVLLSVEVGAPCP